MQNGNSHQHLLNVKQHTSSFIKMKTWEASIAVYFQYLLFKSSKQHCTHQIVLADDNLFSNTFTKRKMECKNRTHLLADSVFLPTVGGDGSLWKKLFIHQHLSINSGNPAKQEKAHTIRHWLNYKQAKPEDGLKEGNNTMKCFVLVCNVHSIRTAGGAGRNTRFRVLSCCSWKTETHVMKKNALREYTIPIPRIFRPAAILEETI